MLTQKVSKTLSVESFVVTEPGGQRRGAVRIIREDGGLVVVELDEVRDLISALTEASARLAAELAGEEYHQGDLF